MIFSTVKLTLHKLFDPKPSEQKLQRGRCKEKLTELEQCQGLFAESLMLTFGQTLIFKLRFFKRFKHCTESVIKLEPTHSSTIDLFFGAYKCTTHLCFFRLCLGTPSSTPHLIYFQVRFVWDSRKTNLMADSKNRAMSISSGTLNFRLVRHLEDPGRLSKLPISSLHEQ